MKKKLVAIITIITMTIGTFATIPSETVRAAEEETMVDGSVLLNDAEESVGEMEPEARGQYLQTGTSKIVRAGTGKITVGATTVAQKQVSTIKAAVMVERLVNGNWVSYTSWTASKTNAYSLTTSKTLTVPRGYYYRVRSIHSANSDIGNSNTAALYVS